MNKGLKVSLAILGIIIIGFIAVQCKKYYEDTYVGSDYYLQVPSDQDTTIEEWQGGQYTIRGRRYKLTAYNKNGEFTIAEFSITDASNTGITEEQLLQPNTYIKVNASKNRVISWGVVKEQEIPQKALDFINEDHK